MMNIKQKDTYKEEFKQNGHYSEDERESLVKKYSHLVKYIANRIAMRVPPNVSIDDLISNGSMGLLDAISKFDPSKNVKFKTYAEVRIRGSILDGLRNLDWIPRSVRKKIQDMEKCIIKIEKKLGRPADDIEIAQSMNVDIEEYHNILHQAKTVDILSLDEPIRDQNQTESRESYVSFIPSDQNPFDDTMFAELKDVVAKAIQKLSKKEQRVVALYYNEGLTLKEIGATLDLTESRISQIHTQCIIKLRSRLSKYFNDI